MSKLRKIKVIDKILNETMIYKESIAMTSVLKKNDRGNNSQQLWIMRTIGEYTIDWNSLILNLRLNKRIFS